MIAAELVEAADQCRPTCTPAEKAKQNHTDQSPFHVKAVKIHPR